MISRKSNRKQKTILVGSCALALMFLGAGATKLADLGSHAEQFTNWGFPLWFMYMVGVVEVVGGGLLLAKKTRFFGGALLAAVMVGAVGTLLAAGQLIHAPVPALFFVATTAITYAHRDQLGSAARRSAAAS